MNGKTEAGFSYIDVMIALVILLVGILALLSGISGSVIQSRGHERQLIAKQIATSTMESIMSVKETDPARLGWIAVGNVGTNPDANGINRGIFLTGFQPVFLNAGPDEVIGTADDTGAQVDGFQRQIAITDVCDPDRPSSICVPPGTSAIRIRSVVITVNYFVGTIQRQEILTTVLTDYSVTN
jgi:type II secretory pathway pseudopilin PulG